MTIAFLSLFFGLITGPYPVELSVQGPVATVELLVDGRSVRTLQGPPWKAELDFGQDLQPHQIVARALDADGKEIARAGVGQPGVGSGAGRRAVTASDHSEMVG